MRDEDLFFAEANTGMVAGLDAFGQTLRPNPCHVEVCRPTSLHGDCWRFSSATGGGPNSGPMLRKPGLALTRPDDCFPRASPVHMPQATEISEHPSNHQANDEAAQEDVVRSPSLEDKRSHNLWHSGGPPETREHHHPDLQPGSLRQGEPTRRGSLLRTSSQKIFGDSAVGLRGQCRKLRRQEPAEGRQTCGSSSKGVQRHANLSHSECG